MAAFTRQGLHKNLHRCRPDLPGGVKAERCCQSCIHSPPHALHAASSGIRAERGWLAPAGMQLAACVAALIAGAVEAKGAEETAKITLASASRERHTRTVHAHTRDLNTHGGEILRTAAGHV